MNVLKLLEYHFWFLILFCLSCELDNFTFEVLYWVILYWYYIKSKYIYNSFVVPSGKSKMVSFASSIMKNIVFSARSRFSVKLICCITFRSSNCYSSPHIKLDFKIIDFKFDFTIAVIRSIRVIVCFDPNSFQTFRWSIWYIV